METYPGTERAREAMAETRLDLDGMRDRADAATEGPWPVSRFLASDLLPFWRQDAEFLAHAREDIPALLAEVDHLNRVVDGEIEEKNDVCDGYQKRTRFVEAENEDLKRELQRERESYAALQHDFEVHFKRAEDLDAPCHACHELELEESERQWGEFAEDLIRLGDENADLRAENERLRHDLQESLPTRERLRSLIDQAGGRS
jgi:chromosome segregation ATPase